jgi:phospholipase C
MLVLSPFSRGGFVCSERFDHTSTLRFIEARFGARVPNLSAWRRSVTGDLTSAFGFGTAPPDTTIPKLPSTSLADPAVVTSDCPVGPAGLTGAPVPPYPVPPNGGVPKQASGRARRRPPRNGRVRDGRHVPPPPDRDRD